MDGRVALDDTIYLVGNIHNPTTGESSLGTAVTAHWAEDGGALLTAGITITEAWGVLDGQTLVAIACTAANGFEVGKRYVVTFEATCGGVNSSMTLAQFMVVPAELVAGHPLVDIAYWKGVAPAALTASGFVQAILLRWLTDNAAGTPIALSTTTKLVQSMLTRWATDDAAGTVPTPAVVGVPAMNTTHFGGTVAPAPAVPGIPKVEDATLRTTVGTPAGASIAADIAAVKSDTAAVKAKTDNLPSDPADESLIIAATDAVMARLGTPAGASVSADVAAVKADTAAVKAKTDNLPTDPADESALEAAIIAATSPLATSAALATAQTAITSIQNNTRCVRVVPETIIVPDAATRTYRIELLLYDEIGNMETPDSDPTITLVNEAGTDRSSRLDSTTMAFVSTGRYRAIYTSTAAEPEEQLVWTFSVVEGGLTRLYGNQSSVAEAGAGGVVDANVVSMAADVVTSSALAASAANEIRDAIIAYAHAAGTTLGALFERLEASLTGELVITEVGDDLQFVWKKRGGATSHTGTVDPVTGNRGESTLG